MVKLTDFKVMSLHVNLTHPGNDSSFLSDPMLTLKVTMSPVLKVIIPILFIIGISGIGGNFLLLCVMRRSKTVHRTYGISLSILGLTDSLNILIILLQVANDSLRQIGFYHLLYRDSVSCKILDFITYFAAFTSAWLVVCITCERLLVIYFPLRGRICCRSYYAAVLGMVVILSAATQLPRLWLAEFNPDSGLCQMRIAHESYGVFFSTSYHSYLRFVFFYGLPCLIIFICNILIIMRMHGFTRRSAIRRMTEYRNRYGRALISNGNSASRSLTRTQSGSQDETEDITRHLKPTSPPMCPFTISRSAQRDRLRATQILVVISCTYLICFAPDTISELYFAVTVSSWVEKAHEEKPGLIFFAQFDRLWRFVFQIFTVISYGSNFYTYLLFGKRFRREISSLLPGTSSIVRHQNNILYHPNNHANNHLNNNQINHNHQPQQHLLPQHRQTFRMMNIAAPHSL